MKAPGIVTIVAHTHPEIKNVSIGTEGNFLAGTFS
jgi:hypothetical protein